MANSTSRSRRAAVCLCSGFGKRGRRWISLHDTLARHDSATTANKFCSDTSHIPDWPCRFLYTSALIASYLLSRFSAIPPFLRVAHPLRHLLVLGSDRCPAHGDSVPAI